MQIISIEFNLKKDDEKIKFIQKKNERNHRIIKNRTKFLSWRQAKQMAV